MKTTEQKPLSYKTPWNVKYSVPSNPYIKHHIRSGNRVVALVNPTLNDIQDTTDETAPEGRVHADFIIKACNMHNELVAVLEKLFQYWDAGSPIYPGSLDVADARALYEKIKNI